MKPIDVLIVGGGPGGLAAAIRLRQRLDQEGREASVVVIDKAPGPGYHNLSGAAFEPACLEELLPGWQDKRSLLTDHFFPVGRDEMYFLLGRWAIRIPSFVVPRRMHHHGDVTISVSRLVQFLAREAAQLGVEVYHGYSARDLIVEQGAVRGVRLVDSGLDRAGQPKPNYMAGEEVRARVTILADGTHGVLSTRFGELFGGGRSSQIYSVGIKAVVQYTGDNPFGADRVVHTLGYPCPNSVFGGGFIYGMGDKHAAVGLILGLDWKYGDLNPQREFERYRAHPFVRRQLEGSVVIATGAKTIPEGGFYSLGALSAPGGLVVGDGAGLVNIEKIKGLHYAVRSGMCAADTVAEALAAGDTGEQALAPYRDRLADRGILAELEHARNYRQSFRWGLYVGTPLSLIQSHLPAQLATHPDRVTTRAGARLRRADPGGMDQTTFISLTGSMHREDEPSHVSIPEPALCVDCGRLFDNSCTHFCPGQVYRWNGDEIVLSPSNCLHCMTCAVKCPYDNIRWLPPEGGEGPRYKNM
jgi:electron-transferring-flavoprotein dehydrogenase